MAFTIRVTETRKGYTERGYPESVNLKGCHVKWKEYGGVRHRKGMIKRKNRHQH